MQDKLKLPLNILRGFREEFESFDDHDITWSFTYHSEKKYYTIDDFSTILSNLKKNFNWLIFNRISIGHIDDAVWTTEHPKSCLEWIHNLPSQIDNKVLPDTLSGMQAIYNFDLDSEVDLTYTRDNAYLEIELQDNYLTVDIYLEDFPFYQQGGLYFSENRTPFEIVKFNRCLLSTSLHNFTQSVNVELDEVYTENNSNAYTVNSNGIID